MTIKFTSNKAEVFKKEADAKRSALDKMGDFAVQMAQNYATVDTGNMRASIMHEERDEDTEVYGTNNNSAPYKEVDYAPFVEFGTRKSRAQPFIRPAAENHRNELEDIAKKELGRVMG